MLREARRDEYAENNRMEGLCGFGRRIASYPGRVEIPGNDKLLRPLSSTVEPSRDGPEWEFTVQYRSQSAEKSRLRSSSRRVPP